MKTTYDTYELEIAKIGPFGVLQAGQEASQFLDQLQSQESVLGDILGTLDLSTREGRIQSNQLLLQVRGLEREERELRRSLITAFLDAGVGLALGLVLMPVVGALLVPIGALFPEKVDTISDAGS